MRTHVARQCGALALIVFLLVAADADEPTPARAADASASLASILEDLGRRHKALVRLDPEVASTASSWRPKPGSSLNAAFGSLVASTKGLAWRRLYRAENSAAMPSAEEMAAAARALEGIAVETLLVETPGAGETWIYRQTRPTGEGLATQLAASGLNARPIHLIYRTDGSRDGLTTPRRLATLERRQVELPLREEHLAHAMTGVVRLMQELPPDALETLARQTVAASDEIWNRTPPERRSEMIRQTMDLARRYDPASPARPASGGASAPRPAPSATRGRERSLPRALSSLAARHGATIVLDPGLQAATVPTLPPADAELSPTLDALAAAVPNTVWRRVYLPAKERERLDRTRERARLVEAVQALGRLEIGAVAVEDPSDPRATFLLSRREIDAAAREREGCDPRPVYVLFATETALPGATPEASLGSLQRQQFSLLTRLSAEQLAHSMSGWARAYETADGATRARILGLPVMAGMMAGWFPREAKERAEMEGGR